MWRVQLLFCAADFVDELLHARVIFLAGLGFDAAGDVHRIRSHAANRRAHIFWRETARQHNTVSGDSAAGNIPIRAGSCAAKLARTRAIEQESESVVILVQSGEWKIRGNAKRFDNWNSARNLGNDRGSFVTVKLGGGKAHESVERIDFRWLGVHEEADSLYAGRKLRAHGGGFDRGNAAKALFVEIKAEHVGARIASGFGVRPIGNAANLDEDHGLVKPVAQRGPEKSRGRLRGPARA